MLPAPLSWSQTHVIFPEDGQSCVGSIKAKPRAARAHGRARRGCNSSQPNHNSPWNTFDHFLPVLCQPCCLPVSARDAGTGGEKCLGPALNCRWDGICATLLENHLGIQMHGLFPSLLHFKRCKFPFAFSPTFLLWPRRVWKVFATFIWLTAALSSHRHDPPTSQPASNQAFPPWQQAAKQIQGWGICVLY